MRHHHTLMIFVWLILLLSFSPLAPKNKNSNKENLLAFNCFFSIVLVYYYYYDIQHHSIVEISSTKYYSSLIWATEAINLAL